MFLRMVENLLLLGCEPEFCSLGTRHFSIIRIIIIIVIITIIIIITIKPSSIIMTVRWSCKGAKEDIFRPIAAWGEWPVCRRTETV